MMKKITKVLLIAIAATLMMTLVLPDVSHASDNERSAPRYVDEVGLLTESQVSTLTTKLDEISERQQFDVVIYVTYSTGGLDTRVYAADFFEKWGFGYGDNNDGIILMLAMEYRDFAFVTTGYGLYAFTDAGQEHMENRFLPHLRNDEYFEAFMVFADSSDELVTKARAGERYDSGNIPMSAAQRQSARYWTIVISLAIAFGVPAIVTGVWKSQLKSVRSKDFACDYIRQGSMVMNIQQDIFLHRNISRTRRAQSSSSGGGSGSFKSSSGSSFSGRSGRF